jgi:hypothetical protein
VFYFQLLTGWNTHLAPALSPREERAEREKEQHMSAPMGLRRGDAANRLLPHEPLDDLEIPEVAPEAGQSVARHAATFAGFWAYLLEVLSR